MDSITTQIWELVDRGRAGATPSAILEWAQTPITRTQGDIYLCVAMPSLACALLGSEMGTSELRIVSAVLILHLLLALGVIVSGTSL